jgi:signal transduction histidine kinase
MSGGGDDDGPNDEAESPRGGGVGDADGPADARRGATGGAAGSDPEGSAGTGWSTEGDCADGRPESHPPGGRSDGTFASGESGPAVDRVLLLVGHARNRSLLAEWFAEREGYDVIDGSAVLDAPESPDGDEPAWTAAMAAARESPGWAARDAAGTDDPLASRRIDLVLVDAAGLDAGEAWLRRRRERDRPLPLPCLLLGSETATRRAFAPAADQGWTDLVDDVVSTPVDPVLLDRRLGAYLRVRRQAAELSRRHDQLSLLAGVVRHDIANAATVISGWGKLLRGEVTPSGQDALDRILRAGRRITDIVDNSRDLTSLIDAGRDVETEPVDLARVLRAEVETIERVNESTQGTVVVDCQSPLPAVEVVAGGMLPSVFSNLLSNAVRHCDADPTEVTVTVEVDEERVVVRVADNGPGIGDDRKSTVFEPATKRGGSPGDGLGLALVRRLVESYDGHVWFEDRPSGERGVVACVALQRASPGPTPAGGS